MPNPTVKQIAAARERAQRIREFANQFRRELQLQRVAEIHCTQDKKDVRLFVVKLPSPKSQQRAA